MRRMHFLIFILSYVVKMLRNIWNFIQNELLGMQWLNRMIGSGLENLGIDTGSRLGGSVQFFVYDVIKIMVLLTILIYVISFLQSYFPPERTKKILNRYKGLP